jgi:capsular polysaccharide biosynthesis protein
MHTNRKDGVEALRLNFPVSDNMPNLDVNIKGWRTWGESFKKLLKDVDAPVIVEVGSWFGKNVIELSQVFPKAIIISIDTWEGGIEHQEGQTAYEPELSFLYEQFIRNIWGIKDRVIPIKSLSWKGLEIVKEFHIEPDLIYIDAGHIFECVSKDVETACKLFPNSIICGDDYDTIKPNEVKEFVDSFTGQNNINLKNFERFWWFENVIPNKVYDVYKGFDPRIISQRDVDSIDVHRYLDSCKYEFDNKQSFFGGSKENLSRFTNSYNSPPVWSANIDNAIVSPRAPSLPRYWIVFADKFYIKNFANDAAKEKFSQQDFFNDSYENTISCSLDHVNPVVIPGKSLFLYIFGNWNHLISESLLSLYVEEKYGDGLKGINIVVNNASKDIVDLLSLYGVNPDQIIVANNRWYKFDNALLPCFPTFGFLNEPNSILFDFASDLRSRALARFHDLQKTGSPKRIFVSRKNARQRRLENESQVFSYLEKFGFVMIEPGEYNLLEQIKLFSGAEIVIGAHGMGINNFIFSNNARLLVEIFTSDWVREAYYRMAQHKNCDYAAFIHQKDPLEENDRMCIDSNAFIDFLNNDTNFRELTSK